MKIKKLLCVLTACLLMTVICCGCTIKQKQPKLAYNAELVIDCAENERRTVPSNIGSFSYNFWRENMVRAWYFNEDYDSDSSSSEKYFYDETMPESILYIVKGKKKYNHIFNSSYRLANEGWIDFEKEMLIVYVFVGHGGVKRSLTEVSLDGKDLTIKYECRIVTNDAGTDPKRRVMVIKLDKLDIETVNFI